VVTQHGEAPLTTRSVLLSVLLGTDPPEMSAQRLVQVGGLFGFSGGAVRTSLTRMTQRGELVADDGRYRLGERLLRRQARQFQSRRAERHPWSGRWQIFVVTVDARAAKERSELRAAMAELRLALQREGVWLRPDNLAEDRLPVATRIVDDQCYRFVGHPAGEDTALAEALWDLSGWAERAVELRRLMAPLTRVLATRDVGQLRDGFVVSAACLRHFQADPLLPAELLDRRWPGDDLRRDYDRFDREYRATLSAWFTSL